MGAGIVGAACARALAVAGARVRVLDPGPGRAQGSWASAGILSSGRPHELPDAVHVLADRSLELWHELGARHPELEHRRIGAVLLGADPEWTSWRERRGLVSEPVEWQETSAIRFPEVAVVRSPRCAPALLGELAVEPARVDDLNALRREADVVVVAAGAWASPLLAQAGIEMEIAPRRGQMLLFRGGRTPGVLFGAGDDTLAVPRDDGRVVVGTTLEDVGFDASTVPEDLDRLESWARRVVPDLGSREDAWAGLRPYGPVHKAGWASGGCKPAPYGVGEIAVTTSSGNARRRRLSWFSLAIRTSVTFMDRPLLPTRRADDRMGSARRDRRDRPFPQRHPPCAGDRRARGGPRHGTPGWGRRDRPGAVVSGTLSRAPAPPGSRAPAGWRRSPHDARGRASPG